MSSCLISIFQGLPRSLFAEIICQSWIWLIILTPYQMRFICPILYKLSKVSIIVLTFLLSDFYTSFTKNQSLWLWQIFSVNKSSKVQATCFPTVCTWFSIKAVRKAPRAFLEIVEWIFSWPPLSSMNLKVTIFALISLENTVSNSDDKRENHFFLLQSFIIDCLPMALQSLTSDF